MNPSLIAQVDSLTLLPQTSETPRLVKTLGICLLTSLTLGCGTTRMTDTQRTATEQLLISNAIDQVVSTMDFRALAGKSVYFDPQYLDNTIDKGYVVSSLRQQLLAQGCLLQEDRTKATYVVEARSGGIGTDHYSVLVGVPQMAVPTFVPGQPSQIPEIPFAKKTDEQGIAKIALFAYNRQTGIRVWQSGVVEASSSVRDTWVAGLGPFRAGTTVHGTAFAGEELPLPLHGEKDDKDSKPSIELTPATAAATWPESPAARNNGERSFALLTRALFGSDSKTKKSEPVQASQQGKDSPADNKTPGTAVNAKSAAETRTQASTEAKSSSSPNGLNIGGQAETAPAKILISGLNLLPDS
jgi:hypothetical protein